jgi:hypothetical protein
MTGRRTYSRRSVLRAGLGAASAVALAGKVGSAAPGGDRRASHVAEEGA